MNKLLYPFSFLYSALSNADRRMKKAEKLDKPVISVGNITWGGTGKTPMVIELLEFLIHNGMKPAVLTRGYGRKNSNPLILKNGAYDAAAQESGDEPLLIARSVPGASVIVGAERYKNALRFKKEADADVFVLDDGFQHWKIQRDVDIVCVNAANPFGNGMLIPAGILREKPEALRRADIIVLTNTDLITEKETDDLRKHIFHLSGKEPVVTHYGGYEYKTLDMKNDFDAEKLKNASIYSLSAIGFSEGFRNSIIKTGLEIEDNIALPDHKNYTLKTIKNIMKKIDDDAYLVTTAKDAVKINAIADKKIKEKTAVLTVKPVF